MKKILFISVTLLLLLGLPPLSALATTGSTALKPGTLIKAGSSSVYYYGADGKRYVFPNEKTYKTWFIDFNLVITISNDLLGEIPIGGNVTYKPGKKLLKIQSDPRVYFVDSQGTLREIKSEQIAKDIYGASWQYMVDDIPDAFFVNYKVGAPIETPDIPSVATSYSINEDKGLAKTSDPTAAELSSIEISAKIVDNTTAEVDWEVKNFTAEKGFKVLMSSTPNPVYPGSAYHYLSDPMANSDKWYDLFQGGTYYFRVCEYLGSTCGIYSNTVALPVSGTAYTSTKKITLTVTGAANSAILNWQPNFTSSQGFKLVKAEHSNPIYPGDDYQYLTDPSARDYTWTGLTAGQTMHFRVCEYLGGKCGVYSNDVSVKISGQTTTDNSNGTITLTGSYDPATNKVNLSWTLGNMISDLGFKVVYSAQPYPVYPGNEYHYLSDANARYDYWQNLEPGTYHFRVCEYLGGSCGIYSNDLAVNVQ
jgi:hypothetical protein